MDKFVIKLGVELLKSICIPNITVNYMRKFHGFTSFKSIKNTILTSSSLIAKLSVLLSLLVYT